MTIHATQEDIEFIPNKRTRMEKFELKQVNFDGKDVWKLKCPGCGTWGHLDDDQFNGRVSVQCLTGICKFHETHNFSKLTGEQLK